MRRVHRLLLSTWCCNPPWQGVDFAWAKCTSVLNFHQKDVWYAVWRRRYVYLICDSANYLYYYDFHRTRRRFCMKTACYNKTVNGRSSEAATGMGYKRARFAAAVSQSIRWRLWVMFLEERMQAELIRSAEVWQCWRFDAEMSYHQPPYVNAGFYIEEKIYIILISHTF